MSGGASFPLPTTSSRPSTAEAPRTPAGGWIRMDTTRSNRDTHVAEMVGPFECMWELAAPATSDSGSGRSRLRFLRALQRSKPRARVCRYVERVSMDELYLYIMLVIILSTLFPPPFLRALLPCRAGGHLSSKARVSAVYNWLPALAGGTLVPSSQDSAKGLKRGVPDLSRTIMIPMAIRARKATELRTTTGTTNSGMSSSSLPPLSESPSPEGDCAATKKLDSYPA